MGGGFAERPADLDFPLVAAALGKDEQTLHTEVAMLLDRHELWQVLVPMEQHQLRWTSTAFRLLSGLDCLLYASLTSANMKCPIKIFGLLGPQSESVAEALSSMPACCLGPFVKDFMEKTVAHGGVRSPLALAKLRLLAILGYTDTGAIEARHAAIRRRLMSRGVQTHSESLEEVSAEWLLDQLRLRGRPWVQLPRQSDTVVQEAGSKTPEGDDTGGDGRIGGPWRAYLRKTREEGGLPDMTAKAQAYRNLDDDEMAELVNIGSAAAAGGKSPLGGVTSFGPSSRKLRRVSDKQLACAKSRALSHRVERDAEGLSRADACSKAVWEAIHDDNSGDLNSILKVAKKSMRAISAVALRHDEEISAALTAWRETEGKAQAKHFVEKVPLCAAIAEDLVGAAFAGGPCLRFQPNLARVAAVGRFVMASSHRSNLVACLEKDWAARHLPIEHHNCRPITDVVDANAQGSRMVGKRQIFCCDVGFCICGDQGRAISQMRGQFYRAVRTAFPASTREQALLKGKFIVAEVRGHRVAATTPWTRAVAASRGTDIAAEKRETLWLHFGSLSLSPFEICCKQMEFLFTEKRCGVDEVHLQAIVLSTTH